MSNLLTAPRRAALPVGRQLGVRIGADHIDAQYLRPARVAARRSELEASGYPVHVQGLVIRLEARENTLLDSIGDGTGGEGLEAEERELAILQRMLDTMQADAKARAAITTTPAPAEVLA